MSRVSRVATVSRVSVMVSFRVSCGLAPVSPPIYFEMTRK